MNKKIKSPPRNKKSLGGFLRKNLPGILSTAANIALPGVGGMIAGSALSIIDSQLNPEVDPNLANTEAIKKNKLASTRSLYNRDFSETSSFAEGGALPNNKYTIRGVANIPRILRETGLTYRELIRLNPGLNNNLNVLRDGYELNIGSGNRTTPIEPIPYRNPGTGALDTANRPVPSTTRPYQAAQITPTNNGSLNQTPETTNTETIQRERAQVATGSGTGQGGNGRTEVRRGGGKGATRGSSKNIPQTATNTGGNSNIQREEATPVRRRVRAYTPPRAESSTSSLVRRDVPPSANNNNQDGLLNQLRRMGRDVYKTGGNLPMNISNNNTQSIGQDAVEFQGPKHSQGGIPLNKNVEVEGGETMDKVQGQKYVFSDQVKVPGTDMTFAEAHKQLVKEGATEEEINQLAQLQEQLTGRIDNSVPMEQGMGASPMANPAPMDAAGGPSAPLNMAVGGFLRSGASRLGKGLGAAYRGTRDGVNIAGRFLNTEQGQNTLEYVPAALDLFNAVTTKSPKLDFNPLKPVYANRDSLNTLRGLRTTVNVDPQLRENRASTRRVGMNSSATGALALAAQANEIKGASDILNNKMNVETELYNNRGTAIAQQQAGFDAQDALTTNQTNQLNDQNKRSVDEFNQVNKDTRKANISNAVANIVGVRSAQRERSNLRSQQEDQFRIQLAQIEQEAMFLDPAKLEERYQQLANLFPERFGEIAARRNRRNNLSNATNRTTGGLQDYRNTPDQRLALRLNPLARFRGGTDYISALRNLRVR